MGPAALLLQIAALAVLSPQAQWSNIFAAVNQNHYFFLFNILIFAPISEEVVKYLPVRYLALKKPDFDEPLDAMIYLIISALGFAATENLLNIFLIPELTLQLALSQAVVRFLSATFLHALVSGILGYFIASALLNFKKRRLIFTIGFLFAFALHGLYNYLAWLFNSDKIFALAIAGLLVIMAGLVSWQFRYLKKQLSVCKIR